MKSFRKLRISDIIRRFDMKRNTLIKYLIPLLIVIIAFIFNRLLGYILFFAFVLYILFMERSAFYIILTNRYYKKGDLQKALRWLKKAYETSNKKPGTAILYGYLLLKTGNVNESEKVFLDMLNSNIDQDSKMKAKSNYALVLWKKGQLEEAVRMLEEVFADYKNTTIYGSLGYLLILTGDLNRALEFNREAYDYNDSDPVILDNLGYTYYKVGNKKRAEEIYEKLMGLNPSFPEAYYNYSCIKKDMGELKKALEFANKAKNYRLSYLSNLTEEELDSHLKELEHLISMNP